MPTPPYSKILASIGGGATTSGGLTATSGQTVTLTAESIAFWGAPAARWEIYEYPTGFSVPAGWTADPTGPYYYLGTTPPGFTLPALPTWGKFGFSLVVNGGSTNGIVDTTLTDLSTWIEILSPNGLHDLGYREEDQYSTQRAWVEHHKANLRTLDTGLTGGTSLATPSTTVKRDSSGGTNLSYIKSADTLTSSSGVLRVRNASVAVTASNLAVNADIDLLATDTSDNVLVGDATDAANVRLHARAGGSVQVYVNSVLGCTITDTFAEFSGQITSAISSQAFTATPTFDFSLSMNHVMAAATANITTITLTAPRSGGRYLIQCSQDGTGTRTIAWPAATRFEGTDAVLGVAANNVTVWEFFYDGSVYRCFARKVFAT